MGDQVLGNSDENIKLTPDGKSPFDDMYTLLKTLPKADTCSGNKVREDLGKKPLGGQGGRLTELAVWLAEWQGNPEPKLEESHICVLASSYKEGMAPDSLKAFMSLAASGQSSVNRLCVPNGVGLRVLEMALEMPHVLGDWDRASVMAAAAFGMEATAAGGDLLGLGDLAFGNEASSIAILCRLLNIETSEFAMGAGLHAVAEQASKLLRTSNENDPLEVLIPFGGREMAAAIGAIIAARSRRLPIVLDGWSASVAAVILWKIEPSSIAHCVLASSLNDAHGRAMAKIGLKPILDLSLDTGMGTGSAMTVGVLSAALSLLELPSMQD